MSSSARWELWDRKERSMAHLGHLVESLICACIVHSAQHLPTIAEHSAPSDSRRSAWLSSMAVSAGQ